MKQKSSISIQLKNLAYQIKVRQGWNYFFKSMFLPKNELTNSTLLLVGLFLFIFWKKVKTRPKRHFEISSQSKNFTVFTKEIWNRMISVMQCALNAVHIVVQLTVMVCVAWSHKHCAENLARGPIEAIMLKVSYFQKKFMKSSFLPKYEQKMSGFLPCVKVS